MTKKSRNPKGKVTTKPEAKTKGASTGSGLQAIELGPESLKEEEQAESIEVYQKR